jgi:signal transduction histidine kinase/ActR/RegA family two-component response regulator
MTQAELRSRARRVVILAPTGKDAALAAATLNSESIDSVVCSDLECAEQALEEGAGLLLIAEEALTTQGFRALAANLAKQPPWSDLPVLLMTRYGADSGTVAQAIPALGNVTLLERPLRPTTLISAVKAALKARERQYQVGEHLAEQARINKQLEDSIKERERVEEALRDADRRKDEFLATLAHELRNPLAPIRNTLHILRLADSGNPATAQICEMMERQVGHLVRLVDDLMEVSRITRGKIELRPEPVEVAAIIRSAVEASRPLIEQSRHQLAISIPPEALVINGDPVRLSQVVSNLLNNSAKYMDEGGQIWLGAKKLGDRVILSVRDTGIGIPPEMLPHIFKMFTQVDRSKRQAQGGLGIGLSLVRTLVEMHGGEVEALSAGVGQGSEFILRLPLSNVTSVSSRSTANARVPVLPNHRILVVDDNRDGARSLGLLLKLLGAEVEVVHDGPAALAIIPSYAPTVVLLDIGMPGMDGYEVARRIRERPAGRDVLLIALTGWGQEADRQRTTEAGFDHHLLKPADLAALESLLTSMSSSNSNA